MINTTDYPFILFFVSFFILWGCSHIGQVFFRRGQVMDGNTQENFSVIQGATLTLLGLIIGFSFSMAISRYDLRKNHEEAEANAIGTEYLRADLLPAAEREKTKDLLVRYTEQRILFYRTRGTVELSEINNQTNQLQNELWTVLLAPAKAQSSPSMALVLSGMNDVLNSAGYTQAAWWNRIPPAAWMLMSLIAICCCTLVGYGFNNGKGRKMMLLILPLVIAFSFMLIADIDSPRGGVIKVVPQNLESLAQSLSLPTAS
ncbi:hypothetical protein AXW38_05265 [Yersinia ruckeri]|uniref:DUF4239 domain-containing protein n=1 Tax=Yersinia ruckeri TaxID=29486 RepID=A0A085U4W7_YERRU|nr:hypothetical protein [Yersinia ruckeri]AKA37784.1 hypothetical protein UGYR_04830 [Yersinia ruckeri]ARZ00388.1 hypothetical protein QMA0440_01037 [Yersinia ruckeri]AUQ42493.1 hypothetical protein NJ56_11640 [Yersinia ruckeri]EEQ00354.1 hypothetical protein yruck0001_8700 [Yersinia ruckeri ATCC 29473]EKN4182003.1 hypothetical protein [Yersinia ruckeri]